MLDKKTIKPEYKKIAFTIHAKTFVGLTINMLIKKFSEHCNNR